MTVNFFGHVSAYDAAGTGGLTCPGYAGIVSDGRYLYFTPNDVSYCNFLRYDPSSRFKSASSWSAYHLGTVDELTPNLYNAGCFDGRYLYFSPGGQAIIVRFDTYNTFKSISSWNAYDASTVSGLACGYFNGCCFDGRYIYFVPGNSSGGGHFVRYDTLGPFRSSSSWSAFDIPDAFSDPDMRDYGSPVFDGRYIYFIPTAQTLKVLRYDTTQPFNLQSSWSYYDISTLSASIELVAPSARDDTYIYILSSISYSNHPPIVVRYNWHRPFELATSWDCFIATEPYLQLNGEYYFRCAVHNGCLLSAPYRFTALGFDTSRPSYPAAWTYRDVARAGGLEIADFDPDNSVFGECMLTGILGHRGYFYISQSIGSKIVRIKPVHCLDQSAPDPSGAQDLTDYDAIDYNEVLTITSTSVTGSELFFSNRCNLYKDFGIGAFDDVEIDFDFKVNYFTVEVPAEYDIREGNYLLSLSNSHRYYEIGEGDLSVGLFFEITEEENFPFISSSPESESYVSIDIDTTYYCTLLRSAGSDEAILYVYSDSNRSVLVGSAAFVIPLNQKWRILYAFDSADEDDDVYYTHTSYTVSNIDVISH